MDPRIRALYSFISNEDEISESVKPVNKCLNITFKSCFENDKFVIKADKQLEIESVLDYLHDELNTGHWSEVPVSVRRAFTAASFVKTVILLHSSNTPEVLQQCLKALDMGLLLGAHLEINTDLLTNCATYLSKHVNEDTETRVTTNEKRKHNSEGLEKFESVKGVPVDVLSCPSLETFNKYFTTKVPLKLQGLLKFFNYK